MSKPKNSVLTGDCQCGWLDTIASLPAEMTQEAMSDDGARRYINYQHRDHDTPADWSPFR